MNPNDIRVLVVDDSAVTRTMICDYLAAAPGISVAGVARNGREALCSAEFLQPDVITLDQQMPDIDGLQVLDAILEQRPTPIVMVSALTCAGATVTLEALDRGAADYIAKPEHGGNTVTLFAEELIHKIRNAACMDIRRMISVRKLRPARPSDAGKAPVDRKPAPQPCNDELADKCVALGISTGGPPALTALLGSLRPAMPPIIIVQHMPAQFTKPLADRLNSISTLNVREAVHGERLQPNCVLIAPGGKHLELQGRGSHVKTMISDGPPVSGHKPSVDVMMRSAAEIYGQNCLGIIMTGMGRDGADGCRAIRQAGGYVLGQDQESSAVYGMNRVAQVEGNVDQQFALTNAAAVIAKRIHRWGRREVPC
jgi:two-component system, chemotaxis family, protein-glutamate methylesterase/glutaminase